MEIKYTSDIDNPVVIIPKWEYEQLVNANNALIELNKQLESECQTAIRIRFDGRQYLVYNADELVLEMRNNLRLSEKWREELRKEWNEIRSNPIISALRATGVIYMNSVNSNYSNGHEPIKSDI